MTNMLKTPTILFLAAAFNLLLFQALADAGPTSCESQAGEIRVADARKIFNRDFDPVCQGQRIDGCKLAVLGAAYGGVYFAYRLALDEKVVKPKDVCVFEANPQRIGGRIYTVRNLLGDGELAVDMGGYRYVPSQKLIANLIEKRLNLTSRCYYPLTCEDSRRVVADETQLNTIGFIAPVEKMLQELVDGGARMFHGYRLSGIFDSDEGWRATQGNRPGVKLEFVNGGTAEVAQTMLNIPNEAVARLDGRSLIFNRQSRHAQSGFMTPETLSSVKVYLEYDDAWWITKLGKFEGVFDATSDPKLRGRYHDGAVRCFDDQGAQIPLSENWKIARCNGLLLATYFGKDQVAEGFYLAFQKHKDSQEPLSIIQWDESDPGFDLITAVHEAVMNYHATELAEKGVNTSEISPPSFLYLANWRQENDLTGSVHEWPFFLAGSTVARTTKALLRPVLGYDVFIANEAFGVSPGWAEGSLMMAERVLAHELGIGQPSWLEDEAYYEATVKDLGFFDLMAVQLFDHKLPQNAPNLA